MEPHNMWPFVSGFFHLVWVFKVYSYYNMYQYLVSFYSWEIFHCIAVTYFYSVIIWWTFNCFPLFFLLWTMLTWIFMCMFFAEHLYTSVGREVAVIGQVYVEAWWVYKFMLHQERLQVSVAPSLCQHLVLFLFEPLWCLWSSSWFSW